MRGFVLLVVIGVFCCGAKAQTLVEGYVFDDDTGSPVAGAEVVDDGNSNNVVISDTTGWFSLTSTGKSLTIRHISYSDYNVNVNKFNNGSRIMLLAGSGTMLNQTVIGADKMERTMKEQIVSVEIVNPALIKDKNPINIDEIVNQVSGVVTVDGQVNIRNGTGWSYGAGTRALVMVDGMPLISGDAGSVQWNFISTDNIKSMEVVKGASSVLYGSSALNGMINIRSAWPKGKPKTTVTGFVGAYSKPSRETLQWSDKTLFSNGLRILDSRRVGRSDLVTTFESIDDQGYRFGDFDNRYHVGIDFRRRTKKKLQYGVRTHLLSTTNGSFLLWKSYDSAYNALDDNSTITEGLKFRLDPFLSYRTSGGWVHNFKGRYLSIDNQVDNGNPDNDQSNTSVTLYGDYQSSFRLPFSAEVTYGVTLLSTTTNSPLFEGQQVATNGAGYLQWNHKIKKLSYTLGTRYEKYALNDYKEEKPVFRAGMNYGLAKGTFFRASYGQGYRFPTIAESFIKTNVGLVSVYPNNQLQSETGDNLELGIKQGFKNKKIKGYVDVALFQMTYQNMMEFTFGQWSSDISPGNGFGVGFKSLNTGETTIQGVDISLVAEMRLLGGNMRLFGGYTYSIPTIDDPDRVFGTDSTGQELSYSSTSWDTTDALLKYRNQRTFKMDIAYNRKRFEAGISWRYGSQINNIDQAFVGPLFATFVPGIEEGMLLNPKGAWVTDIRLAYRLNSRYRLGFVIKNLANKEYVTRPSDVAAPRLVMAQLKATI